MPQPLPQLLIFGTLSQFSSRSRPFGKGAKEHAWGEQKSWGEKWEGVSKKGEGKGKETGATQANNIQLISLI